MGDSFSSGEGAGDYDEPTDRDDRDFADWMDSHLWWPGDREPQYHNGCHRSANAYGSIVAAENDFAGGVQLRRLLGGRDPRVHRPERRARAASRPRRTAWTTTPAW